MKTKEAEKKKKKTKPKPKPRKHWDLWQMYLCWDEAMQMRKRHNNRLKAINRGDSKMDASIEESIVEWSTRLEKEHKATLRSNTRMTGSIYKWLIGIKGIGVHSAAKLIAHFDDPALFSNPSKFWRFAGYAVIDGKREHRVRGEKAHYNNRLKSECYLVGTEFIRHQTPVYADIFYHERDRIRREHPEPEPAPEGSRHRYDYTDEHVRLMAMGKMIKTFLVHFWVQWRSIEGLPLTDPYVLEHLDNHSHYIEPAPQA